MATTVRPTHDRRFGQTVSVAAVSAIAAVGLTLGISALLNNDESAPARASTVAASTSQDVRTADAAEHWLAVDRTIAYAVPQSADAADHWIGSSGPRSALPISPDAAEYWAAASKPRPSAALPSGADAAERWLASD
jgi:hypothetical protein